MFGSCQIHFHLVAHLDPLAHQDSSAHQDSAHQRHQTRLAVAGTQHSPRRLFPFRLSVFPSTLRTQGSSFAGMIILKRESGDVHVRAHRDA